MVAVLARRRRVFRRSVSSETDIATKSRFFRVSERLGYGVAATWLRLMHVSSAAELLFDLIGLPGNGCNRAADL